MDVVVIIVVIIVNNKDQNSNYQSSSSTKTFFPNFLTAVVINRFFTFSTLRVSIYINDNKKNIIAVITVFIFLTIILVGTIINLSVVNFIANSHIKVEIFTLELPFSASASNTEHKNVPYAAKNYALFFIVNIPGDNTISLFKRITRQFVLHWNKSCSFHQPTHVEIVLFKAKFSFTGIQWNVSGKVPSQL